MGEMDVIINTPVLVYGAQLPIDSGKVQGSGGTLRFSLSYTVSGTQSTLESKILLQLI